MKYRAQRIAIFTTWSCRLAGRLGLVALAVAWLAAPAIAQAPGPGSAPTPNGGALGAWGLIALGAAVFVVFFGSARPGGGRRSGAPERTGGPGEGTDIPLLSRLQQRIEQETTGWRRYQWPVIGLIFIAIGLLALLQGT